MDEFHLPFATRSIEQNNLLLKAMQFTPTVTTSFNIDSFQLIIDSGASSTATPCKADFIKGSYQKLTSITISGIASGLKASGVGSVIYKIKDDDDNLLDFQIDKVLHLENLITCLISP